MPLQCPYCRHAIGVKAPKPGRYTTKCPKCSKKFLLTVPDDPSEPPVVAGIRSELEAGTLAERPTRPSPGADETTVPSAAAKVQETVAQTAATAAGTSGPKGDSAPATVASGPGQATAEWQPGPSASGMKPSADPGETQPSDAREFELATGASGSESSSEESGAEIPNLLGGYQVLKELGRGGMGAVYLAKQLSLDRNVALKVMKPEWASNPTFVARFTREAYAAAQLVHHNVVQIYDFGQERGTNYFSMEFVPGQTLSALVKAQKKLDPEVAVGYTLQAARGLKSAHDQSMIHRDIKPDNLLLNDQGVVKVADLGLVKTPAAAEVEVARELDPAVVTPPGSIALASSGGAITIANIAMGTPAYMAPEQARDAAGVDARADIYSLGCTLYTLVTGRPPFEGKSAYELFTKHQSEPITPPEMIVKRVPKALSEIILRMVAKKPEDRYANLGEVIKALEDYLGISSTGPFSPREEHANQLSECVDAFNASPTARLRPKLLLGGAAACLLVVVLSLLARQLVLAGGFLGLGLMTALAYFVITGVTQKTPLFLKTRAFVFGGSVVDWLILVAGVVLFVTMLVVAKLLWAWVAFGVVAVLIAIGLHAWVDRKADAERAWAIETTEEMLKKMRLNGLDEDVLRQFVCKYSGERWEEFYEALFGYEAKLVARDRWGRGERGRLRKTFGAWRDPIIRWIEAKQQGRREAREKKLLQKIEEKGLEAQGINLMTARRKAQRAAEAMVATAAEIKEASRAPAALRVSKPSIGQALRKAADKPEDVLVDREKGLYGPRPDGPLNSILGPKPRFLAGAVLLGACLFWLHQNELLTEERVRAAAEAAKQVGTEAYQTASKTVKSGDASAASEALSRSTAVKGTMKGTRPLRFPFLPERMAKRWFNSFNPGVAGLILLISSFFRGVKMSLFAVPAAALVFFDPSLGVPALQHFGSIAAGSVLAIVGWFFGRTRY